MDWIKTLVTMLPKIYLATDTVEGWDSMIVDRRRPVTYRASRHMQLGDEEYRVCLHKFEPCNVKDAFSHPHPWPAAILCLYGAYGHKVGFSDSLTSKPQSVFEELVTANSIYQISGERTWHSVVPHGDTFTVMINGKPFDNPHQQARRTAGKDLRRMSHPQLAEHLNIFRDLLATNTIVRETVRQTHANLPSQNE